MDKTDKEIKFQQLLKEVKNGATRQKACQLIGVSRSFIERLTDLQKAELGQAAALNSLGSTRTKFKGTRKP